MADCGARERGVTRANYIHRLGHAVAAAAASAVVTRLALGERWFSFYGIAAAILVALAIAAPAIVRRSGALGYVRWPAILLLGAIALAALAQIAFWAAFFWLGPDGLILGLARTMLLEHAGPVLPYATGLAGLLVAWLAARGLGRDLRQI